MRIVGMLGLMLGLVTACGGDGGQATSPSVSVTVTCEDYTGGPGGSASTGDTTVTVGPVNCPKDSPTTTTTTTKGTETP